MIEKTIKVGSGLGPLIGTGRYKNMTVHVSGLEGVLSMITDAGTVVVDTNGAHMLPLPTDHLQIYVQATKGCAVVKLRAEAAA